MFYLRAMAKYLDERGGAGVLNTNAETENWMDVLNASDTWQ